MDRLLDITRVGRRGVLRAGLLAGSGLAAASLLGCGSTTSKAPEAGSAKPASGGNVAVVAPEPGQKYPKVIPVTTKAPKRGGVLSLSKGQDIGDFDPTKSGATGNLTHSGTVYDTLLRRKMTQKATELRGTGSSQADIEGNLAASWETTPDGITYTFKLRSNVKWHNVAPLDGRAFTAADVRKAYERYATTGVWQDNFETMARIEAVDATTLKVTLKRPQVDFIVPLAEQNNAVFPMEIVDNKTISKTSVGTGPMIMTEAKAAQQVKYTRNPDYWGSAPFLDGLEFRIMPDAAARTAAFRADQVGTDAVSPSASAESVRASKPDTVITQSRGVKSVFFNAFNMKLPKWQDARVRQAFSLSIDREAINKTVYEGLTTVFPVMPWVHVFDHEPTFEKGELGKWWRYAPDEAKKLLQAAGVDTLKFDYVYASGYLGAQNEVVLDQFKRAGFAVNAQLLDYVSFNAQLSVAKYADVIQAWDPHGTQADNYFRNQFKTGSAGNWFNISDRQIDQWADQQSVELNPKARIEILRKIWDRTLDEAHRVELPNNVSFGLTQPWLHGIRYILGNDGLGPSAFGYSNAQFMPHVWMDK